MISVIFTRDDFNIKTKFTNLEGLVYQKIKDIQMVEVVCDDEKILKKLQEIEIDAYFFEKKIDKLETIVIKTKNPEILREKYKPYKALANAIRFGRDVFNQPQEIETEIKRLSYLDIMLKGNKIYYGSGKANVLPAKNWLEFCAALAFMKFQASVGSNNAYELEFFENLNREGSDSLIVNLVKGMTDEKR